MYKERTMILKILKITRRSKYLLFLLNNSFDCELRNSKAQK